MSSIAESPPKPVSTTPECYICGYPTTYKDSGLWFCIDCIDFFNDDLKDE